MNVWMTIGYTDFEGTDIDGVFSNGEDAFNHIIETICDMWGENEKTYVNGIERERFKKTLHDYYTSHPNNDYWYFWTGNDIFKEMFRDEWNEMENTGCWLGIHMVELKNNS